MVYHCHSLSWHLNTWTLEIYQNLKRKNISNIHIHIQYYKLNENQFKIEVLFFIFSRQLLFYKLFSLILVYWKRKKKHFYSRINNTYMYCLQILNNNNNYSVLLNFNLDFEGNRVPLYIWQQQHAFYISFFCPTNYLFFTYLIFYPNMCLCNYLNFLIMLLSLLIVMFLPI